MVKYPVFDEDLVLKKLFIYDIFNKFLILNRKILIYQSNPQIWINITVVKIAVRGFRKVKVG